jgi:hypothetical protein
MKLPTVQAFTLVAVGGGLLLAGSHLATRRYLLLAKEPAAEKGMPEAARPAEIPAKPQLYASFARVGRIQEVPPGQELHLLRLRSEKDTEGFVIDDARPNDPVSPQVYRCRIVNRGAALQEVQIEVFAVFFDDVTPTGQSSRGQRYQISIPALGPGAQFDWYVRNDSPGGTSVHLPSNASALVTASGETTKIPLVWKAENTSERGQPPFLDFDAAK